jgi:hypothetical protein
MIESGIGPDLHRKGRRTATRRLRRLTMEALEGRNLMSADVVLQWNSVMFDALRADATQPGPTFAARNLAIVHAAMYDAINAVERAYQPYLVDRVAPEGTSAEAAGASAAYHAALGLYPLQAALFEAALKVSLDAIPDGPGESQGVALGRSVAHYILAARLNDHAHDTVNYIPGSNPGDWRPAPPIEGTPAWGPGWGHVDPFALPSGSMFRPPPPPAINSPEYTAAFQEVYSLGAVDSTTRTADQTQIGIFWGYDRAGMGAPPTQYNQIAQTIAMQENNTLLENARLFALLNIAQADAGVVAWDAKYEYNYWRPITAIRGASSDENPDTVGDPDWTPLGAPGGGVVDNFTPPFPAYTSGHATFGAAAFRILASFYGTDHYNFTVQSDEMPGVTRSFTSFSQASAENARSRIYLGIHWNFDDSLGQSTGVQVADYVFQNILGDAPPEFHLQVSGAGAGGGPHVHAVNAATGEVVQSFFAFDENFRGGVRVATGDVNGDGVLDMVAAAGPGGGPHVRVFDGSSGEQLPGPIGSFFAYDSSFRGGVFVAAGDIDGDNHADIITGAGEGGGPHVRVFSGADGSELASFFAYNVAFAGGVRVAAGDVDGNGTIDIVTGAGPGGGPHVRVFDGATGSQLAGAIGSFFAYDPSFRGGVHVAVGDINGDHRADVITGAGEGGGPHVRVLSGLDGAELASFFAYDPTFLGGVCVGAGDLDGDGLADIITGAGAGGGPHVRAFSGLDDHDMMNFFAYDPGFTGGIFVAGPPGPRGGMLMGSSLDIDLVDLILAASLTETEEDDSLFSALGTEG